MNDVGFVAGRPAPYDDMALTREGPSDFYKSAPAEWLTFACFSLSTAMEAFARIGDWHLFHRETTIDDAKKYQTFLFAEEAVRRSVVAVHDALLAYRHRSLIDARRLNNHAEIIERDLASFVASGVAQYHHDEKLLDRIEWQAKQLRVVAGLVEPEIAAPRI